MPKTKKGATKKRVADLTAYFAGYDSSYIDLVRRKEISDRLLSFYQIVRAGQWRCSRCQDFLGAGHLGVHTCSRALPRFSRSELASLGLLQLPSGDCKSPAACRLCRQRVGEDDHECTSLLPTTFVFDRSSLVSLDAAGLAAKESFLKGLRGVPGHCIVLLEHPEHRHLLRFHCLLHPSEALIAAGAPSESSVGVVDVAEDDVPRALPPSHRPGHPLRTDHWLGVYTGQEISSAAAAVSDSDLRVLTVTKGRYRSRTLDPTEMGGLLQMVNQAHGEHENVSPVACAVPQVTAAAAGDGSTAKKRKGPMELHQYMRACR